MKKADVYVLVTVEGVTQDEFENDLIVLDDPQFEIIDCEWSSEDDCELTIKFETECAEETVRHNLLDWGMPLQYHVNDKRLKVVKEKFSSYNQLKRL